MKVRTQLLLEVIALVTALSILTLGCSSATLTDEQPLQEQTETQRTEEPQKILESSYAILKHDPLRPDEYGLNVNPRFIYRQPPSQSIVWVEPGDKPGQIKLYAKGDQVPSSLVTALGLSASPQLRLQMNVVPLAGRGWSSQPLLGEGTIYYGATQGPVVLAGKKRCFLRGSQTLCEERVDMKRLKRLYVYTLRPPCLAK